MAVLTSGELAMARAMRSAAVVVGRAADVDGDQLPRAFAVAHDLAGQVFHHFADSASSTLLSSCRLGWTPDAPLASSSTVSLVEVSPSTLMRL